MLIEPAAGKPSRAPGGGEASTAGSTGMGGVQTLHPACCWQGTLTCDHQGQQLASFSKRHMCTRGLGTTAGRAPKNTRRTRAHTQTHTHTHTGLNSGQHLGACPWRTGGRACSHEGTKGCAGSTGTDLAALGAGKGHKHTPTQAHVWSVQDRPSLSTDSRVAWPRGWDGSALPTTGGAGGVMSTVDACRPECSPSSWFAACPLLLDTSAQEGK